MADTRKKHMFSAIEALRLMGAVMVVLFHLNAYPSGYKGVDLFFVISGFVLYYRYLRPDAPHEPRSLYFVHRLSKIYILYWTALLWGLLLSPGTRHDGFLKTFFLFPGHHERLSVSWSLSYELYFYALFSIFLFVKTPGQRHTLLFSLLIGSGAITGAALVITALKGSVINFLLGHNTWEFILGLTAGYLFEKRRLHHLKWIAPVLAAALCLFCFLDLGYTNPLTPVVYGTICFGLVYSSACLNKRYPFSLPVLTLLGLSTYAIYLFHLLLIPPLEKLHLTSAPVILLVITLLSVLIHKFYEAPILKAIRNAFAHRKSRNTMEPKHMQ